MKLILQAIKALFRKIEASLAHFKADMLSRIDSVQSTATDAISVANEAQSTANSKMDADNPVGTGSFSMGRLSDSVVGLCSHAEGCITTASGDYSHAEGGITTASGIYSHAEGNSTNVFSSVVTAVNPTDNNIITAWKSKKFSLAKGKSSHVEGKDNLALGDESHAEGKNTTASGLNSHAEGFRTTASGFMSHAEGDSTIASGYASHVEGKYNVEDSSDKYAHIVGNGTGESARSNAHTLDWNGNAWFQGRPQFGGTAQDQDSQTVMANGDKEIILTSSTANSTKKFKITVDDSGTLTATEITQ